MATLRTLLLTGSAIAALTLSGQAHAAFVQVSSLSGGTPFVFGDTAGATYAAGSPVSYTSSGETLTFTGVGNILERDQTNNTYLDSNYANATQIIGVCGYNAPCPAGALTVAFNAPVVGFSLAADDFDTTQTYTFQVTAYNGGSVLGTVSASSLADNGALPAILAATSTVPITSISITDTPTSAGTADGSFFIGNITTVPEPSSLVLVIGGFVGLVGLTRRRARNRG